MPHGVEALHGPEGNSHLTFSHKGSGIVSNTLGRLGSIDENLQLLTPQAIVTSPAKDTEEFLKERVKEVPWKGEIQVNIGHSPLFSELKRLFQKGRRTNIFARVALGIPATIGMWFGGKLGRMDAYNPFTESVQIFHPNKGVAMHVLGRAEDFDQSSYPTLRAIGGLFPGIRPILEWRASRNAMKNLKNNEERADAEKVLTPAFGSYLGPFIPFTPLTRWLNFVPLIAGHIHSRLPGHRNPFGNFIDKKANEHGHAVASTAHAHQEAPLPAQNEHSQSHAA